MELTPSFIARHFVALEHVDEGVFAARVFNSPDDDEASTCREDLGVDAAAWLVILDLRDKPSSVVRRTPTPAPTPQEVAKASDDPRPPAGGYLDAYKYVPEPPPKWERRKIDLNGRYVDDDGRVLPREDVIKPFGINVQDT
ncbi:hypothetical protein [Paraburkholderia domus]|uniref:hypothetical protein n=1 Tax=Paraburkholderia domus TaxID=2793075 RepID=UPI001B09F324|nr:hypothetical protein [Paraburkholderia domus]CAE6835197.1 hypothetical protein R75483_06885 [Paraburkholderia domus]